MKPHGNWKRRSAWRVQKVGAFKVARFNFGRPVSGTFSLWCRGSNFSCPPRSAIPPPLFGTPLLESMK